MTRASFDTIPTLRWRCLLVVSITSAWRHSHREDG